MAGAWLLALCVYSAQAGPLDTAKPGAGDQPSPFIIVAQSVGPGDPFNDNTDRVAEASVLESGKSSPRTAKYCGFFNNPQWSNAFTKRVHWKKYFLSKNI